MGETGYILIIGRATSTYMGEVGKINDGDKNIAYFPFASGYSVRDAWFGRSAYVYITKEQYESEAFRKAMKAFYGTP